MSRCDVCGNEYDQAFALITHDGETFTLDSMECAVQAAAPECARCGCRILGHGVQVDSTVYCCSHCAREQAKVDLTDHAHR